MNSKKNSLSSNSDTQKNRKESDLASKVDEVLVDGGAQTEKKSKKIGQDSSSSVAKEYNGPKGLEPTRYGDWESKGRCHDF